jgi:hypothetical protein
MMILVRFPCCNFQMTLLNSDIELTENLKLDLRKDLHR